MCPLAIDPGAGTCYNGSVVALLLPQQSLERFVMKHNGWNMNLSMGGGSTAHTLELPDGGRLVATNFDGYLAPEPGETALICRRGADDQEIYCFEAQWRMEA